MVDEIDEVDLLDMVDEVEADMSDESDERPQRGKMAADKIYVALYTWDRTQTVKLDKAVYWAH